MESIFKLGIVLSVIDRISGPSTKIGDNMDGLRGKVLSLGPAFNKFKTYGLLVATVAAGLLNMMTGTVMATTASQKALGELASVGIENLQALENAGTEFSSTWSGTTKAEFISAAYDIKSGIASLTDEGVAEFTKLAALTSKATKSTTAEMTSLFATGYGIYKDMYADLTDMRFGEVFSAGISASVENFKTTGSGMSQAISQLGAAATTAKIPLEEQLSILGMLQATMTGSEAGTKYKALMQSAAGAGQKLNLEFLNSNNQLLSMPEILTSLQSKYGSTLDAIEKMEIQKAFGTQEAVAVIDLLYNKVGDLKTNITGLAGAMDQGTFSTELMAAAMNKDIGAGVKLLGQQWHNLVEVIGKKFNPILIPLFTWIGKLINQFRVFAERHEIITRVLVVGIGIVAALALVIGGLVAVLGTAGLLIPNVAAGFSMLGKAALFLKTGLLSAVASTKTWILWQRQAFLTSLYFHGGIMGLAKSLAISFLGAIKVAIASVWSFTAALLANPIGLIAVVVITLGGALYLLYKKFEVVRNGVDKFMFALGYLFGVWTKFHKMIWSAVLHPLESVKSAFAGVGQGVDSLTNKFNSLSPTIQSLIKIVLSAVFPPLAIVFGWKGLKSGVTNMLSWIKGIVPEFLASGKAIWGALSDGIKSMITSPVETVKSGLLRIRDMLPFSDAKEGPLSTLTLSGARMMETIGAGISAAKPGLVKTMTGVMAGVAAVTIMSDIKAPSAIAQEAMILPPMVYAGSQEAQPALVQDATTAMTGDTTHNLPTLPTIAQDATLSVPSGIAAINQVTEHKQKVVNLPGKVMPGIDSEKIKKEVLINKSKTLTRESSKKEVHIHINGLTLPGVSEADSFIKKLLELAGGYDV